MNKGMLSTGILAIGCVYLLINLFSTKSSPPLNGAESTRRPAGVASGPVTEPLREVDAPADSKGRGFQIRVSGSLTVAKLSSLLGRPVILAKPDMNETEVSWHNGTLTATFDGMPKRPESLSRLTGVRAVVPFNGSVNGIAIGQALSREQQIQLTEQESIGPMFKEYSAKDKYWRTSVTVVDGKVHSMIMTRVNYGRLPRGSRE